MPRKSKSLSKNVVGDKGILVKKNVNHSNIVIGDNSILSASTPLESQSKNLSSKPPQSVVRSESTSTKLIPFLCYAKENSVGVREFRERLKAEAWIDPWYDEEDILPGQMWEESVVEAVHNSHAVIVFLSSIAVRKEGFFHKEPRPLFLANSLARLYPSLSSLPVAFLSLPFCCGSLLPI